MQLSGTGFVLAIIAMSYLAWIITTAIRTRRGYPIENEFGKTVHPRDGAADEAAKALASENQQLRETVERLEERIKVLERIATDPSRQIAEEIDRLR